MIVRWVYAGILYSVFVSACAAAVSEKNPQLITEEISEYSENPETFQEQSDEKPTSSEVETPMKQTEEDNHLSEEETSPKQLKGNNPPSEEGTSPKQPDEEPHLAETENKSEETPKENRKKKPLIMRFFLAVDGEVIGNVLGEKGRNSEDEDKVSADDLALKLVGLIDDSILQKIIQRKDEKGFVPLKEISETGIKAKLKMSKLQINLSIPSNSKKNRNKSVLKHKKQKKKVKLKPAKISAVLNGRISHSENSGSKSDTGIFAPNLNLFGLNIEGKYTCQKNSFDKTRWTKNFLGAIYDFRENSNRISAGDIISYAMDYQNIPRLWGFGFNHFATKEARSFAKNMQIEIERPSTIKIYVNDVLLKTERLYPGSYTYNDLPFQYGSNDVKIEITDDTGKVTEISNSYFRDGTMLNAGEYECGFSFGKPELNQPGAHYSDKYMGAGYLKAGIFDGLEANAGYQMNSVGSMSSIGLSFGNFLGSFYGTYARSSQGDKKEIKGSAKKIKYVSNSQQLEDLNINAILELEEKQRLFIPYFRNSEDVNIFNRQSTTLLQNTETLVSSSKSIAGSLNFSLSGVGSIKFTSQKKLNADRTQQITNSIGINKNIRFDDSNSWFRDASLVFDISKTTGLQKQRTLNFGAVFRLKNSLSVSSYASRSLYENGGSHNYGSTISFSQDHESPFSGSFSKNYANSSQGMSSSLHYDSENLKGDFNYGLYKSNFHTRTTKQVAAESNLYFADGEMAISQKNLGSSGFVLVMPDQTLEQYPISMHGPAEADTGGIVDTVPYNEIKTFNVNVSDIPIGMKIHNKTFNALGEYKRGYLVKLKTEGGSCAVKGYLKYSNNTPLKNVSGYMTRISDGKKIPFFTNKKGKFSVIGMKHGKYEVTIFGETLAKPIKFTLKKLKTFKYQKVGTLLVYEKTLTKKITEEDTKKTQKTLKKKSAKKVKGKIKKVAKKINKKKGDQSIKKKSPKKAKGKTKKKIIK